MSRQFLISFSCVLFVWLIQIKPVRPQVQALDDDSDLMNAFKAAYAYSPYSRQRTARQPHVSISQLIGKPLSDVHPKPSATEQIYKPMTSSGEGGQGETEQRNIEILNTNWHFNPATSRNGNVNSRTLHYSTFNQNQIATNQKVIFHQPSNAENVEKMYVSSKNHSNDKLSFMANKQGQLQYFHLPEKTTNYKPFVPTSPNVNNKRMFKQNDRIESKVMNTDDDCNVNDNIEKQQISNLHSTLSDVRDNNNIIKFQLAAPNVNYLADNVEYRIESRENNNNPTRNQFEQTTQEKNVLILQNQAKHVLENFISQLDQLKSMAQLELTKI